MNNRVLSRVLFIAGLLIICSTVYLGSHAQISSHNIFVGRIIGAVLMIVGAALLWPKVSQTLFAKRS